MKKFTVCIEETIVQEFEVMAENADEALSISKEKYKSGKFVLESGEVQFKQMLITKPYDKTSKWVRF